MSLPDASSENNPSAGSRVASAEEWLDLYGDALFQFAVRRTGRRDVSEDLVQETLLAAIKCQDAFRRQASTSTWLFAILRRKIADHFRHTQRTTFGSSPVTCPSDVDSDTTGRRWDDDPARICQSAEFQATFEQCLSKLPDKLADVFVLREMNQYAPGEIRELLGINASTLSMRLHRCRQALRECLNQNWFQSE
ncbi:MAG: RNA polymerase sigma factor [Planctomycetota bacterium]